MKERILDPLLQHQVDSLACLQTPPLKNTRRAYILTQGTSSLESLNEI